ncbi:MAG: hypothetical protein LWW93_15125 [Hyphomicrobiales bacterium]|nr:hypothetical protein [Hyphomicrobiales bacterium]
MSTFEVPIPDSNLERARPIVLAQAHFDAKDRVERAKAVEKRLRVVARDGRPNQASAAIERNIRDAHRQLARLASIRPETIEEVAAMIDVIRECLVRFDDPDPVQAKVYGPRGLGDILDRIAEGLTALNGDVEPCGRAPRPFRLGTP